MFLIFTFSLTGFPELIEDVEVFFFKGILPLTISVANLTEDLEQFDSEDIFLNPFVTCPFLIIPLLVDGLGPGLCFSDSEGPELNLLSSCLISSRPTSSSPGLEDDISSVSCGSELRMDVGLAGLVELSILDMAEAGLVELSILDMAEAGLVELSILDMAEAGLDFSTRCWSVSPAARLVAEAGLCLKRSLMLA